MSGGLYRMCQEVCITMLGDSLYISSEIRNGCPGGQPWEKGGLCSARAWHVSDVRCQFYEYIKAQRTPGHIVCRNEQSSVNRPNNACEITRQMSHSPTACAASAMSGHNSLRSSMRSSRSGIGLGRKWSAPAL